jgi:hypothetical protein
MLKHAYVCIINTHTQAELAAAAKAQQHLEEVLNAEQAAAAARAEQEGAATQKAAEAEHARQELISLSQELATARRDLGTKSKDLAAARYDLGVKDQVWMDRILLGSGNCLLGSGH